MNLFGQLVSLLNNLVAGRPLKKRRKRRGKRAALPARRRKRGRVRLVRRVSSRGHRRPAKKVVKRRPARRWASAKSSVSKKTRPARKSPRPPVGEKALPGRGKKTIRTRRDQAGRQGQVVGRPVRPAQRATGQPDKALFVGEITHYFSKIMVCVVAVKGHPLTVGRKIRIAGKTTGFEQTVKSLQVESVDVRVAQRGQLVGLKVARPVREGDKVYLL